MKNKVKQLTKEQAIEIYESNVWKNWTPEQILDLQLFQHRTCVPTNVFYDAMEKVLGRKILIHEFAFLDELAKEYLGEKDSPTLEETMRLIPEEKRTIVIID